MVVEFLAAIRSTLAAISKARLGVTALAIKSNALLGSLSGSGAPTMYDFLRADFFSVVFIVKQYLIGQFFSRYSMALQNLIIINSSFDERGLTPFEP